MGNVLEFALGIQTSEFLSKLGFASEGVLSFAGLADVVREAWDHTWEAINKGAELRGLSSDTGESVRNLYAFERGLEAVGGQSQNLSMFFLQTQKALSGVNEAGQRTDAIFAGLALDINKLRSEDSVKAVTDIAGALGKLSPTQGAGIAEALFGRFQAESILQIARNMEMFHGAMDESSNTGQLLDKFAKTFEQVKEDWADIENDVEGIWVSIGGGIAPELHKILQDIHKDIKNFGPAIDAAIKAGHLSELVGEALAAGIEEGKDYGEAAFAWLATFFGDLLAGVLANVFANLPGMVITAAGNAAAMGIANVAKHSDQANLDLVQQQIKDVQHMSEEDFRLSTGFSGKTKAQVIGKLKAQADSDATEIKIQDNTISILNGQISDALKKGAADIITGLVSTGGKAVTDADKAFQNVLAHTDHSAWNNWIANTGKSLKDAEAAFKNQMGKSGGGDFEINHYKPEFTALEKMGFIMNGGPAHRGEAVGILHKIDEKMGKLIQTVGQGWGSAPNAINVRNGLFDINGLFTNQL